MLCLTKLIARCMCVCVCVCVCAALCAGCSWIKTVDPRGMLADIVDLHRDVS